MHEDDWLEAAYEDANGDPEGLTDDPDMDEEPLDVGDWDEYGLDDWDSWEPPF